MDSSRPRYDTLDAWRGLACLLVVAFHSTNAYVANTAFVDRVVHAGGSVVDWLAVFAAHGWVGVPLFFVISGYCIAAAADSARRRANPTGSFFRRRLRRIYPPLWAFLGLNVLLLLVLPKAMLPGPTSGFEHPIPHPTDVSEWAWAGQLTLTEEWRHRLVGPPKQYLAGQLWTLCYEEQFYVVTGLIVLLARRRLFEAVAGVSVFVFLKLIDVIRLPFAADGFFFDGLWLAFAAGVAVYYRAAHATPLIRCCLDVGFAAAVWWAARGVTAAGRFEMSVPSFLLVGFVSAAALAWLHGWDERMSKWKMLAPLRWCGVRCYSLYLVHGPVAMIGSWNCYRWGLTTPGETLLVTLPVCGAVSLAAGWAFHRWVEARFLNPPTDEKKRGGPHSEARPAAFTSRSFSLASSARLSSERPPSSGHRPSPSASRPRSRWSGRPS